MNEAERYSVTVRRVTLDGEDHWRATVRELPDIAEFAATKEEAIALATDAVESLLEFARSEGRSFPPPIEDEDDYSGRVTLRMPPTLHRVLAQMAEREATSLNQYIVLLLTSGASALTQASVLSAHFPRDRFAQTCVAFGQQVDKVQLTRTLFHEPRGLTSLVLSGGVHTKLIDVGSRATQDLLEPIDLFVFGGTAHTESRVDLMTLKANEPLLPSATKALKRGKTHGTR